MRARHASAARPYLEGFSAIWQATRRRFASAARPEDRERGDVPGWVMITLMSAVLVAGLLAVAAPAFEGLFESALDQVRQP